MKSAIASITLSTIWLPAGAVEPRPAVAQAGEAVAVHEPAILAASSSVVVVR